MVLALGFTTLGIGIMKPVVLSTSQWQQILADLHQEHPRTVFMIRGKMKTVLGFTVREHNAWIEKPKAEYQKEYAEHQMRQRTLTKKNDPFTMLDWEPQRGYSAFQIHLDFYSERKRTMFLLKYSEIIGKRDV
jgi:hypothetical protein